MTPEDKIREIMTGIGAMTLTVAFMASLVAGGAKKGEQDDS